MLFHFDTALEKANPKIHHRQEKSPTHGGALKQHQSDKIAFSLFELLEYLLKMQADIIDLLCYV